jgi:hypothetical protein
MVVGSWQEGGVGAPRSPAVARQRVDSGFSNVAFFSQKKITAVFSSPFHLKKIRFWPIILQNGTKHHAKILAKRYSFSILDFWPQEAKKRAKKPRSPHPPHEKFGILNGTKYTHKNFDILRFIIPK